MSFHEVGLFHPSAGLEDAGIPPDGPVLRWERSCLTWCRAGTATSSTRGGSQRAAAQLAPSQLCSLVAALQGLCFPSFCKGPGGEKQPLEKGFCKGGLQPGEHGWGGAKHPGRLQSEGGLGTSVSSLTAVPAEDPFPGHGRVTQGI